MRFALDNLFRVLLENATVGDSHGGPRGNDLLGLYSYPDTEITHGACACSELRISSCHA